MSVIASFFGPSAKPSAPKQKFSDRLGAIFGKAVELESIDTERKNLTYGELVARLAACELDPELKAPAADAIRDICVTAGKSLDELQTAVLKQVEIRSLRDQLVDESDFVSRFEQIKKDRAAHAIEFEETINRLKKRGKELDEAFWSGQREAERFDLLRTKLNALGAGESDREKALRQEIIRLGREEANLFAQSGQVSLSEKYIKNTIDNCPESIRIAEIDARLAELTKAGETGKREYPRIAAERQKLVEQLEPQKRLYALGARVKAGIQHRQELNLERQRLQAERLANI